MVGPTKLRATWLRLVNDGLPDNAALSAKAFIAAGEDIFSGLDFSALDAAYLVTAADLVTTEVPPGALGGAATLCTLGGVRSFRTVPPRARFKLNRGGGSPAQHL